MSFTNALLKMRVKVGKILTSSLQPANEKRDTKETNVKHVLTATHGLANMSAPNAPKKMQISLF